jgi:VanZ family protein
LKGLILWGAAVAHMAFIFAASSVPGTQLPGHLWDKLVHLLVYALLGILFILALAGGRWRGVTARAAVGAVLLALLYGISDELHQAFTPNRTPDVMDVVADTLGAAAGVAAVVLVARVRAGYGGYVARAGRGGSTSGKGR